MGEGSQKNRRGPATGQAFIKILSYIFRPRESIASFRSIVLGKFVLRHFWRNGGEDFPPRWCFKMLHGLMYCNVSISCEPVEFIKEESCYSTPTNFSVSYRLQSILRFYKLFNVSEYITAGYCSSILSNDWKEEILLPISAKLSI